MSSLLPPLDRHDRAQVACWLVWGLLSSYHRSDSWPNISYRQQAIRRWLTCHERSADWLETARVSYIAAQVAERNSWIMETGTGRRELQFVSAVGVIDYERPVMRALYQQCEQELAGRGWLDDV